MPDAATHKMTTGVRSSGKVQAGQKSGCKGCSGDHGKILYSCLLLLLGIHRYYYYQNEIHTGPHFWVQLTEEISMV